MTKGEGMSKGKDNPGGMLLAYQAVIVLSALMGGWVFSILWGWFIVPPFHLPKLATGTAIGVMYVARFIGGVHTADKKDAEGVDPVNIIALSLVTPLFILGIGWIIHLFVA